VRATPPLPLSAEEHSDEGAPGAIATLRALQSGELSGSTLSTGDRRRVVEHLWAEGYSVTETAEIVRVCERTIHRDRACLKQANAIRPDPGFIPEMVGSLVRQAEQSVTRLRRLSRDKGAAASAKIEAELGCWSVSRELVSTLQSLGYLPSAPKVFQAELTHRVEEVPSYDELQQELARVGQILAADGHTEVLEEVGRMQDTVGRLHLSSRLKSIASSSTSVSSTRVSSPSSSHSTDGATHHDDRTLDPEDR
jgi:hypothetical protein